MLLNHFFIANKITGFGAVGSMDLLSTAGLINYFGKWTDLTQLTIAPLVIKKGETHVALYGLSYINDQRLSRLLRDRKVKFISEYEYLQHVFLFVFTESPSVVDRNASSERITRLLQCLHFASKPCATQGIRIYPTT